MKIVGNTVGTTLPKPNLMQNDPSKGDYVIGREEFAEQVGGSSAPGKDGIDCTHEWNGTVLTITSASGTSSADLKGDKGDDYTLTEADKQEIAEQAAGMVEIPSGYATEEYVRNKIAEAELAGGDVDLSGYAQKSEIPTNVSQLQNDAGYLTQHQDISGKLDASALPTAINTALAQAKASGEFNGKDGADGYTPQKGIDYFDGLPGKDGADGYTPVKGKDYFDGQPGKDGSNGADGVSPTVAVSKSGKVTTVSITDKNGTKTATINDGADGSPGSAGKDGIDCTHEWNGTVLTVTSASGTSSADLKGEKGDKGDSIKGDKGATGSAGVSVSSVKQTTTSNADGGSNVVTVTLSNGTTSTFTVKNGSTGATGATGATGPKPVKGTDYFTEADKEEIVQQVITALGTPVFGRVDADNNIILTGELADGTYVLKYEDADGDVSVIGTLEHSSNDPTYTNLADPASADWKANSRLNSSGAVTATVAYGNGGALTNFIPCKSGDVIRVKGLDVSHYYGTADGATARATAFFYADNKSTIIGKNVPADGNGWVYADDVWTYTVGTSLTAVSGSNSDIRHVRLTGIYYDGYTANDVIITVNQEIK